MRYLKKNKRSKVKNIWTIIWILDIIAGFYLFVFESYRYQSNNVGYGLVMLAIGFTAIQYMWFELLPYSKWNRAANVLPMFIVFIPLIFGMIRLQKNFLNKQIKEYGIITYGQVIDFETSESKGHVSHYATIKYRFEDKDIIQRVKNDDNFYQKYDSLKIKCSSKKPEIFAIIRFKR
ncbi:MAG: hypothetical protein IPO21_00280 [Bacteroidales bacterium]|nr:hypothetical protein [Bacteroidales bacterium]